MKKLFLISILVICYSTNYSQQTGSFEDPRDSIVYKTVTIGQQVWMAENLACKIDSGSWAYDNSQSNIAKYGYLYNWETAKQACPSGWRLPSETDFLTLLDSVGGSHTVAYQALIPNGSSGFSAQFGGYRNDIGNFLYIGEFAYFWTSSTNGESYALYLGILCSIKDVYISGDNESYGYSVRCLQDN